MKADLFNDAFFDSLSTSVLDVGDAESLPPACYVDAGFYEFEKEAVFNHEWLCVGREDWVKEPGDYFTTHLVDEPIVVARTRQGELKAMSSVCQHRGMLVAEGAGNVRGFVCPYHHWTYGLDGRLVNAPAMEKTCDFDKKAVALPTFKVEVWQGFIFINFDAEAPPLAPRLTAVTEVLAPYELAKAEGPRPGAPGKNPWNWKVMFENNNDGYHANRLHHGPLHDFAQMRLNPKWAVGLATDKAVFYSYAAGLGIPVPPLCAIFTGPGNGFTPSGQILCGLADWQRLFETLPAEFIVKPADACYGAGFNRFSRKGAAFIDSTGQSLNAESLFRFLATHNNSHKLVIQERLWNHSSLQQLSNTQSLQTLRLVTYINPDGEVEFCDALFKLIVGDNLTDNFHWGATGNLVSRLNPNNGVLGLAFGTSPSGLGLITHQHHPKTGRQISGFQLPHFQEAAALAKRTAALLLPLRSIGWDIALTDAGPIIIEGNPYWDPANGVIQPTPTGIIQPTYMELLHNLGLNPH